MKKYDIEVVTVSSETIVVFADSKEQAIDKVFDLKCTEYSEDSKDFFDEICKEYLDNDLEEVE